MKRAKRTLSILLALLMLVGLLPMGVSAAEVIDTIELTLPEAEGETLNLAAIKVPEGAAYEVTSFANFTKNGATVSGNEVVLSDCDHINITLWVEVIGDATFADEATATINGNTVSKTKAPISVKVYYEFYVGGGSGVVDTVEVTMPNTPGETLDLSTITVPVGASYKIEYIDMLTINGANPDGVLKGGDKVNITLYVAARGYATFADGVTATVNGKEATVYAAGSLGFKLKYAYTVNTIIDEIDLTYDADVIDLNTAWTEGEVDDRARIDGQAAVTEGISYDGGNSGLRIYKGDNDYWGVGDGTGQVSMEKTYALAYLLDVDSGYDWVETLKTAGTGLAVKINGVDVTDAVYIDYNSSWNFIRLYYVIGQASDDPIVTGITIDSEDISLDKGATHTFPVVVSGTVADKSVVWTVEGATSANTTIDSTGTLTIGTDETAETLTIKATATADNTKTDTVIITVLEEPPYIDGVDILPSVDDLYTGNERTYDVRVGGTQTDKSVVWTVEGATSANTKVDNGTVTIGTDETAETITVKATAVQDPTKVGVLVITVKQRPRVTEVNLTFDLKVINLNTGLTERNADANVKNNMGVSTDGVTINLGNSGLGYLVGNVPHGIGDGSAQVSTDKNYCITYELNVGSTYDWVETAKGDTPDGLVIKANGVDVTDSVYYEYNSYWNSIRVRVVIGNASCGHSYDNACDADCNECGDVRTVPGHVYDDDKDTDCNECGDIRVLKATIVTQPKSVQVKNGETAVVTVEAVGPGLTYQWYVKNKGATKFVKSSVKTATYSTTMSSASRDRYLYCVIKDKYGNTVQTKNVALRMAATITKQPATAFAKRNATAKVTLTAAGDGLTYQWYVKNPGTTEYVVSSVKSATYSAKMTEQNSGRLVYCVVTDKYGHTAQTKTVVMRMQASIVTQPKSATVKNGTTAKATVKAAGDGLTYTWYIKNKGAKSFTKSSIKTNTYTVKMSTKVNGRQVYCVVKDKYGKTVKSSTVTLKKK